MNIEPEQVKSEEKTKRKGLVRRQENYRMQNKKKIYAGTCEEEYWKWEAIYNA